MNKILKPTVSLGPLRFSGLAAMIIALGLIYLADKNWPQDLLEQSLELKEPTDSAPND